MAKREVFRWREDRGENNKDGVHPSRELRQVGRRCSNVSRTPACLVSEGARKGTREYEATQNRKSGYVSLSLREIRKKPTNFFCFLRLLLLLLLENDLRKNSAYYSRERAHVDASPCNGGWNKPANTIGALFHFPPAGRSSGQVFPHVVDVPPRPWTRSRG